MTFALKQKVIKIIIKVIITKENREEHFSM